MRHLTRGIAIILLFLLLIISMRTARADNYLQAINSVTKLSGSMVAGGEVNSYEISPDGNYVIFSADKDIVGKMELYSVNLQTLEVVKLNENISDDYDISNILISPDSQWVVYSVNTSSSGRYLRSVPIGGGKSKIITHPFHSSSDYAKYFKITPDSAYVIFSSDYETDNFYELYKSPITGVYIGIPPNPSVLPEKLNSGLPADHFVADFDISPSGAFIIFQAQSGGYGRSIWHVSINGGTNTKISTDVAGFSIWDFLISHNNNRVVYRMRGYGNDDYRLYSVPASGGTAVRLDKPSLPEGLIDQLRISNNSAYVVFTGSLDDASKLEIYSAPIAGPDTSMKKLNGSLVSGGNIDCGLDNKYFDFAITSDGATVVYCADYLVDGRFEIFKISTAGNSVVTRLSQVVTSGNGVYKFIISPDDSRVLYYGRFDDATYYKGYSLPISGGTPTQLADFSAAIQKNVWGIESSPDSSWVVLNIGTSSGTEGYRLYKTAITGGLAGNMTPNPANTGHVYFRNIDFTPDSQKVIMISDMDTDTIDELFIVAYDLAKIFLPMTIKP